MRFLKTIIAVCVTLVTVVTGVAQQVQDPGPVPGPVVNIKSYGAIGDGTCHQLSSLFPSLAAAQRVYPKASDLTQCVDWAATQKAIDIAFAVGPTGNDSSSIYCSLGNYQLSNPLFIDQANNSQGSYAAYNPATTYASGANVTYNGIPWLSAGLGNIGNPPTSSNSFPAQLQLDLNDTFPVKPVTITNASPAVFTLVNGNSAVFANQPITLMTQTFAIPGGATPALPTGLNVNQVYYIRDVGTDGANKFRVSATPGGVAIATTGAGVGTFFANGQVWQVAPVIPASNFSNHISFIGEEGLPSNSGCRFTPTSMWMNAAIYLGPQNGVLIKNISVQHLTGGGTTAPYRCNRWRASGFNSSTFATYLSVHAGFEQLTSGGGSSQTQMENIAAFGFADDYFLGTYALGDSNTFTKSKFSDACVGVEWGETQAFINSMYDSSVFNVSTGLRADLSEGVKVVGGNYSGIEGIATAFTIGTVSVSGSTLTATISNPDQYLQSAMCAMEAGFMAVKVAPHFGNSHPQGNSCGYNVFTIVTAHSGIVPFYVAGYNPSTHVINLNLLLSYQDVYQGNWGIPGEITSATTLYAAEMSDVFYGQIQAENLHIESPSIPTTMICNCGGFGAARVAELRHILLNAPLSFGPVVCCGQTPTNAQLAQFYAQQTVPAINASGGDVIIDGLAGGGDISTSPNLQDRVLIGANINSYVEGRHINSGLPAGGTTSGQLPLFDFLAGSQGVYTTIEGTTNDQLSGGYFALNDQAFGGGTWDKPDLFMPASRMSLDVAGSDRQNSDIPSVWRSQGWGLTPSWGVRPAPYGQACILPSMANTLEGTLPSITWQSQLVYQSFMGITNGGTGYAVNDTITLNGGTHSVAGQLQVTAIGGGGAVTAAKVVTQGVYSVEASSFTQASTSGGGTLATFNNPFWFVNYAIPYPALWGGQLYRHCDVKGPTVDGGGKYTTQANNTGYSYFQNLTTTNVPNLSWTLLSPSPFVYMNQEALELMYPGLTLVLTPDGTGGCAASAETFMVLEVHPTAGFVKVVGVGTVGSNLVPQWGFGITCKNTVIGQQAPNLVHPY